MIHICYCTDDNYAPYALVSIKSALANKFPDTKYKIYLGYNELSKRYKDKFKSLNVELIKIDNKLFENYNTGVKYITESASYRLLMPLLVDAPRLLYIDCDTLIEEDLSELYNYSLHNKTLGAVPDPFGHLNIKPKHIPSNKYFNSGVLLFDVQRWRDNNYFSRVREDLNNKLNTLPDQDALNRTLANDVEFLPLKYNLMIRNSIEDFYPENLTDYLVARFRPVIRHYISVFKPWHTTYIQSERNNYFNYIEDKNLPEYNKILEDAPKIEPFRSQIQIDNKVYQNIQAVNTSMIDWYYNITNYYKYIDRAMRIKDKKKLIEGCWDKVYEYFENDLTYTPDFAGFLTVIAYNDTNIKGVLKTSFFNFVNEYYNNYNKDNPHCTRWCISLAYVIGYTFNDANWYKLCLGFDYHKFDMTILTKQLNAVLYLGEEYYEKGLKLFDSIFKEDMSRILGTSEYRYFTGYKEFAEISRLAYLISEKVKK